MAKVMLVEDDNNLREIYEARLLAEGYEIISAQDGEEALALAVKEKPDLIIADIMMPKISGFDMLDILRSTAETKETKVVMMTALSQAEDKERASKLGADRYLVKSQVTLEDVARVAHEVLTGKSEGPADTKPLGELPKAPLGPGSSSDAPKDLPPVGDDSGSSPPVDNSSATTQDSSNQAAAPDVTVPSVSAAPTILAETSTSPVPDVSPPKDPQLAQDEAAIAAQLGGQPQEPSALTDNTPLLSSDTAPTITGNIPMATPPPSQPTTPTPQTTESTSSIPTIESKPPMASNPTANNDGVLAEAMAAVNGTKLPEPTTDQPGISQHGMSIANNSTDTSGTGNTSGTTEAQSKTVVHTKVISPINDLNKQPLDFQSLVAKEEAKEQAVSPTTPDQVIATQVNGNGDEPPASINQPVNNSAPGTTTSPSGPSAIAL